MKTLSDADQRRINARPQICALSLPDMRYRFPSSTLCLFNVMNSLLSNVTELHPNFLTSQLNPLTLT